MREKAAPSYFQMYLERHVLGRGWKSLAEFAKAAGLSPSVVYRWTTGESEPSIPNARKAAGALEVPVMEFLVASGAITAREAGVPAGEMPPDLAALSDDDLVGELRRRLTQKGEDSGVQA